MKGVSYEEKVASQKGHNQEVIEKSKWWKKFRRLEEEGLLPLKGDWVLIERVKPMEFVTKGGLFIPKVDSYKETTVDRSTSLGLILAVGPGQFLEDGTVVEPNHKAGDVVLLPHTTDWFDVFFDVHLGEDQIGRVRDYQIPMGTANLRALQSILNGE